MFHFFLTAILIPSLWCCGLYFLFRKNWGRRVEILERDLQQSSEAVCQMAEIQMNTYQKLSGNMGDIEERILDLTVPHRDSNRPLERRHHVLSLANKGVSMDEIVKRLNVPRGEAELILGLRKYKDCASPRVPKVNGEGKRHAQV